MMALPRNRRLLVRGAQRKWLAALGVGCSALALTSLPDGMEILRYERSALASGELWRVLGAHFVHINTMHLLYNLLGLGLICELLWGALPARHGLGMLLCGALAVSAGIWWLQPQIAWYAGLSGALHALWAGCALAGCWPAGRVNSMPQLATSEFPPRRARLSRRWIFRSALALLCIKLYGDWIWQADAMAGVDGLPVVSVSHLYGAAAGLLYIAVWRVTQYSDDLGTQT